MQYIHSGETEKKVRINIGSGTKVERKNLDEMDDIVTAEKKRKKKRGNQRCIKQRNDG